MCIVCANGLQLADGGYVGRSSLDHPNAAVAVSDYRALVASSWNRNPYSDDFGIIPGRAAFISFSFEVGPTNLARSYGDAYAASFEALTPAQQAAARAAFALWGQASGITFIEVPAGQGDIRMGGNYNFDAGGPFSAARAAAYAGMPNLNAGSEIMVGRSSYESLQLFLHEIGHALGLKHSFEGDFVLPTAEDNYSRTVMSYTSGGFPGNVLGSLDIEAIQYLYGGPDRDGTQVSSWSWDAATYTLTQNGSAGDDFIRAMGATKNIIDGGAGADVIVGSNGVDIVTGGDGNDKIVTHDGNDVIYGGAGNDQIETGRGRDTVWGGDGNDFINVTWAEGGAFFIDGGSGNDFLNIAGDVFATTGLVFDLGAALAAGSTIAGVEQVSVSGSFTYGDRIVLAGGNEYAYANGGDDVIRGGGGSDYIHGGDGMDTSEYIGARRQYSTVTATRVTGGPEGGTDTLVSIEQLAFADGILTFDVNSQAAQVMRLYDAALDRLPDPSGLEAVLDLLEGGRSLAQVAQIFLQSAEFQARYGALNNQQFVEQMYRFCLDREGDAVGIQAWTDRMNAGTSRTEILVFFSESAEHRTLTQGTLNRGLWVADEAALKIARMYDATFDRLPDGGGLAAWTAALKGGTSLLDIAAAFASSAEFQSRYGSVSNEQFVRQMYQFTLNREADAGGLAVWTAALNNGTSRAQLLLNFSESAEHISLTRELWIGGVRTLDAVMAPTEEVLKDGDGRLVLPGAQDGDDLILTDVPSRFGWSHKDEIIVCPQVWEDGFVAADDDLSPLEIDFPVPVPLPIGQIDTVQPWHETFAF